MPLYGVAGQPYDAQRGRAALARGRPVLRGAGLRVGRAAAGHIDRRGAAALAAAPVAVLIAAAVAAAAAPHGQADIPTASLARLNGWSPLHPGYEEEIRAIAARGKGRVPRPGATGRVPRPGATANSSPTLPAPRGRGQTRRRGPST